ncbi:hypothetical protein C7443_10846 [Plasticicumulans acidivorans]|uniref:Uncharacterized protein n=1 Tax=Plasticicumulans acidivorans TaxID=886464 RepID=A0A317MXT5_9GAMM|nr:hypothetical protein C7443_10846 [Plasticicumulans acidivorans]
MRKHLSDYLPDVSATRVRLQFNGKKRGAFVECIKHVPLCIGPRHTRECNDTRAPLSCRIRECVQKVMQHWCNKKPESCFSGNGAGLIHAIQVISLRPLFFRPARHPQKARDAQQALHQLIATRQSAPLRRDAHRKQEKPAPAAVPEKGQVTLAVFGTTDRAMRLRRTPIPLAAARHCNRLLWRGAQPQEEPASERQRPIRQARGCAAMPHKT